MSRRSFVWAAVLLAAALVTASLSRLAAPWLRRGPRPAEPERGSASERPFLVPPERIPVLLAVSDVIVPREGEAPAASEIDLVPRLERWLRVSASNAGLYRAHLARFDATIRARIPFSSGRPDPELLRRLCESWYRDVREGAPSSGEAALFERLRRDVLRVYYASPAGWAVVGYGGPVRWTREQMARHSLS